MKRFLLILHVRRFLARAVGVMTTLAATGELRAGPINIPNSSFEAPPIPFAAPTVTSWQKTPKPDWYDEGGGFYWDQLTGQFKNTAPASADHIDNCDGNQALWLFAVPEVGLFQDYDSMDWNDPAPTHDFNAVFEAGKSYHVFAGILGTGGGMSVGATLELSLYYRDAASNRIAVGVTRVTNAPTVFSNNTHFIDFGVHVPLVKAADAWAGRHLGVQFLSTVSTNLSGGYWDLDNVRLFSGPALLDPVLTDQGFHFTLVGEPGRRFEILTSTNSGSPLSNWSSLETLSNLNGTVRFTDVTARTNRRFYRARQLP